MNTDNINKKRRYDDSSFNILTLDAINQIESQYINNLNIKGRKLSKFLNSLSENINHIITCLNIDIDFKSKVKDNFRFKLINETHILKSLIDDIYKYSIDNKSYTFMDCLNIYKSNLNKKFDFPNKKSILMKNNDNDEEYKDDDDDDDDDDDSSSSSSSEEEEEIRVYGKPPKYLQESREFIEQIFKVQIERPQTEIINHFTKLPDTKRKGALSSVKEINNYQQINEPLLFQILNTPIPLEQKNMMLKTYTELISSRSPERKLKSWFDALMSIPFGKYKGINLKEIKPKKIKYFLDNLQNVMDKAVFGHNEAKRQIIQIMGQQIRNPQSKGSMLGIWGPPGNGKCFALDTLILMHDGHFKKIQYIKIGDIVMGDDSKPRNVLSLGCGEDEMYQVLSNKGEYYTVNSEHILCLKQLGLDIIINKKDKFKVQYFNKKSYKIHTKIFTDELDAMDYLNKLQCNDDVIEITIKDYLKLPKNIMKKLKGYKTGIDFEKKDVLFDPYIIGVWLGNSTLFKKTLDFLSKSNEIQLHNALITYNLLNNKHIPDNYKINDRDTRLKLLAGLIDTDGYYNIDYNKFELIQKSNKLSNDIIYLARSLGFAAYMYKNKKFGTFYNLEIYGNLIEIPTLCQNVMNKVKQNYLIYGIQVIPKGRNNYYGFTLDGNNRFLLSDFSVTHNTSLIKEGISKAMDKPFIFISLGGATDSSFLEGHSYTYEGSIYGRIADGLITCKCMNPIIYFDELDKISKTPRGDEISNILVHLTDPVQNTHFRDKYFHGIDIDLSKATMIFSFNDPYNVNPILIDRITTVETKYLLLPQKIYIAQNHLLPEMIKEMGMNPGDVSIDKETITFIIDNWTHEGGVRKLKSLLYSIVREINIANLTKILIGGHDVNLPFNVSIDNIKIILKYKREITPEKTHQEDVCGIINGLYATSDGSHGGIIPIQIVWFPSTIPLDVKATGNLQQVIKESTQVAASLAFNRIDPELQEKYLLAWKDRPKGIHIHCPEGATPKDGPSAGTALTVAIYSILTERKIRHDIAITGEINLQGRVTAIGGLDNKLEGAKKAGIKLVLYPKENEKDVIQIKERNPLLIDDTLQIHAIETIEEALLYALL